VVLTYRGLLFFFFQAEDGIRDDLVTGVQTCALPISAAQRREQEEARAVQAERERAAAAAEHAAAERDLASVGQELAGRTAFEQRSEERRVGKECRSGRSAEEEKE